MNGYTRIEDKDTGSVRYILSPPVIPKAVPPPLPRYVAPPVDYTPTMACQHCVVGTAKQIAVNQNVELYECPRCGGHSTLTHTMNWWVGFSF